jgi:hypothetical protein
LWPRTSPCTKPFQCPRKNVEGSTRPRSVGGLKRTTYNGATSGCPPPSRVHNYRCTLHTQQRNRLKQLASARFWTGVAQIARSRLENFVVKYYELTAFRKSSICATLHCEGGRRPRSSTQIDTPRAESCAGIERALLRNRASARLRSRTCADRNAILAFARTCRKALFCRHNLNRPMSLNRASGRC